MSEIDALAPIKPWVWQLRLSEVEFYRLETALQESIAEKGGCAHLNSDNSWARILLVYIAEWYKRRYQSSKVCPLLEAHPEISLEQTWKASNFAWARLVYLDEGGNRRWLYSAYVLGGLAIRHELGRSDNDKLRFLKALCRIYHHEDYTLENLEDESRAVSFRQSVKRHSLHDYMQEILNGNLPFNVDDLADSNSEVNRFVLAIRTANDEVMHDKFSLEWVITNAPGYRTMSRALRLWLRPEEVRGGLHQYLRYDRMSLWKIKHPEKLQSLKVGVRFLHNGNTVSDVDWSHSPISFHNTGDEETGFVAVGVERCTMSSNVPTKPFDTIIIVARDDREEEYELQREKAPDLLQVWREAGTVDRWSSQQNAQRETAVLFSSAWHLKLDCISDAVEFKPFHSRSHGKSDLWGWYLIYDKATLNNGPKEITLYNRQGYDRISTRLYLDTIHYENAGFIKWHDDEEDELLPLIFGPDDVIARHFATKDDITNAKPDKDTEIGLIEFKQGANYAEWTDSNRPAFGKVKLRLTVKNQRLPFEACYLPSLGADHPIVRDFVNCTIRYAVFDGLNVCEQIRNDNIALDHVPLNPTVTLTFGHAEIEVYRPTLIKEVYLDDKIISYLDDGEELNLPYIFKNRVEIADYSRQGYRRYKCENLASIYDSRFINIKGNSNVGLAALAAWKFDIRHPAILLDEHAPEFLTISFGDSINELPESDDVFLYWKYAAGTEPKRVDYLDNSIRESFGIIFQDLKKTTKLTCHYPLINSEDDWDSDDLNNMSAIDCFLQAINHNTYFFIFQPLFSMDKEEYGYIKKRWCRSKYMMSKFFNRYQN